MIGGWYCLGEYDVILIADVPNIESMAAIAVAIAAGGAQVQPYHCIDDRGGTCGSPQEVGARR
jgi:hypothetical protein